MHGNYQWLWQGRSKGQQFWQRKGKDLGQEQGLRQEQEHRQGQGKGQGLWHCKGQEVGQELCPGQEQ